MSQTAVALKHESPRVETERIIQEELDRLDNRHIRDLAVIGLDLVTGGKATQGQRLSDEMIEKLKQEIIESYSKPIDALVTRRLQKEGKKLLKPADFERRRQDLVKDAFNRALGRISFEQGIIAKPSDKWHSDTAYFFNRRSEMGFTDPDTVLLRGLFGQALQAIIYPRWWGGNGKVSEHPITDKVTSIPFVKDPEALDQAEQNRDGSILDELAPNWKNWANEAGNSQTQVETLHKQQNRPKSLENRASKVVQNPNLQHSIHAKLPQPQAVYDPARDSMVVVLGTKIRPDVTKMPPAGISSSFVPRTGGPKKRIDPYNLDPEKACSGPATKAINLNIASNTFKKPKRSKSRGEHLRKPLNYPIFSVPVHEIESKIKEFVDKDKRSKRFADKERDGLSDDMSREGHEEEEGQITPPIVISGNGYQDGGHANLPLPIITQAPQESNTAKNSKREQTSHYEIYQNDSRSNLGSKRETSGWNAGGSAARNKREPEPVQRERSDSLEGGKSNSKSQSVKNTAHHDTPSFPQKGFGQEQDRGLNTQFGVGHTGRSFADINNEKQNDVHYFEISDAALNQGESNRDRVNHQDSVHKKQHASGHQLDQTNSKSSVGGAQSRKDRELGESEDRLFQYSATNDRLGPRGTGATDREDNYNQFSLQRRDWVQENPSHRSDIFFSKHEPDAEDGINAFEVAQRLLASNIIGRLTSGQSRLEQLPSYPQDSYQHESHGLVGRSDEHYKSASSVSNPRQLDSQNPTHPGTAYNSGSKGSNPLQTYTSLRKQSRVAHNRYKFEEDEPEGIISPEGTDERFYRPRRAQYNSRDKEQPSRKGYPAQPDNTIRSSFSSLKANEEIKCKFGLKSAYFRNEFSRGDREHHYSPSRPGYEYINPYASASSSNISYNLPSRYEKLQSANQRRQQA